MHVPSRPATLTLSLAGCLPKRIRNWSDGGRAHFKNYAMLMFMSSVSRRYGTKWWWSFFQSCHGVHPQSLALDARALCQPFLALTRVMAGRGMHDGAGAWVKSAVARACLAGVGIANVHEFFKYCIEFLDANTTKSNNFTSERHFYLISIESVAMYRSSLPSKVTGSCRILQTKRDGTGWFFFATTDEVGVLVQRRCACPCSKCQDIDGDFTACARQAEDSCDQGWWNAPHCQVLALHAHMARG